MLDALRSIAGILSAKDADAANAVYDAADEIERLRSALKAAKLWMDDVTDPCGEPYNTICAALDKAEG